MSLVLFAQKDARKVWLISLAGCVLVSLIGLGAMAQNGWLPRTDPVSGRKTGWFGKELAHNAVSTWNPFAAPTASPTPDLSKEYIYAGSRLLAVQDANANAAPPGDLAVWRPGDGYWYVVGGPGSAQTSFQYGMNGDKPAQGDYDGDGKTDFAVVRPNNGVWDWYIWYSAGSSAGFAWGATTDLLAIADYDGDGKSDVGVWRNSNTTFYIIKSSDSSSWNTVWGSSGDKPVPADFDGDGKADLAVYSPSSGTFTWKGSSNGQTGSRTVGASSEIPVPADYDGDGKADAAVFSGNMWSIQKSSTSQTTYTSWQSGNTGSDIPVPNDYDGDGEVDIAFWRPSNGNWYIRQSGLSNSLRQVNWGMNGDIPVPAYYRR